MVELINKIKLKFELQTFITICFFVFGLWVTWANLSSTQKVILTKLDELALQQEKMVTLSDAQHIDINKQLSWISPTVQRLAKIDWVDIFIP